MPPSATSDMTNQEFIALAASLHPHARQFVSQRPGACAVLSIEADRCRMQYNDEAIPAQIAEVFAQAVAAGHTSAAGGYLIDFTDFTGTVDWEFAKNRGPATPGLEPPHKIAYVARNEQAMRTATAIIFWLQGHACRVFPCVEDAEAWLGWR